MLKRNFFPFTDSMILNTEDPKKSQKRLLKLTDEFSKIAEYELNKQKSIIFGWQKIHSRFSTSN